MRKCNSVPLTIVAGLALLSGCRNRSEIRNCVDRQGRIVPDRNCGASSGTGGGYRYVYGGSSGGHVGDAVVGGRSTPSESGVSRGGFGHAGGEGGGE